MRFTMKPGVERACTATLPQAWHNANTASATARSECSPEITSTSFITGTGLKKCMPTTRPDVASPAASAVTEIDEVFVASTASPERQASSSRNRARLTSRFLDHRLDHETGVAGLGERVDGDDTLQRRSRHVGVQLALAD